VARQFLRHLQAIDGAFHGVMKYVQADQARVEIAIIHARMPFAGPVIEPSIDLSY
jgi:hypothetical protein